jgi:hypothetical protein
LDAGKRFDDALQLKEHLWRRINVRHLDCFPSRNRT